jgi:DUF1680 family protein
VPGDRSLLALDDLDYYQDAEPVREARGIVGHAVRALYLAAGVTDIYAETGDEALLASMLRQWDDLASDKSYLAGGVGSRHYGEAIGNAYERNRGPVSTDIAGIGSPAARRTPCGCWHRCTITSRP